MSMAGTGSTPRCTTVRGPGLLAVGQGAVVHEHLVVDGVGRGEGVGAWRARHEEALHDDGHGRLVA